jgi:hypothetical protein
LLAFELFLFPMEAYYAYKELVDLDVSYAQERLGGPTVCSISGKHDEKYFKLKPDMQLSFKENINNFVQRNSQASQ